MIALVDDAVIATARLVLRPLCIDDADEMVAVLGDVALHEFTGGEPATLDGLRARYETWVDGSGSPDELWMNWIVRRKSDTGAVGTMQATVIDPDGTAAALVAWTIGVPWQGQGYAGEAATGLVEWLIRCGVESVVAHIHPEHQASAAVAARAGLRRTAEVADGEVVWRRG